MTAITSIAKSNENTLSLRKPAPAEQCPCLKEAARSGTPFVEAYAAPPDKTAEQCP
jgi:hypothetical protein